MHRADRPPVHEMARAKPSADGFDLPDSIEIDPIPPPRETRVESPKPPKVTLFPIPQKPAPPPPRHAAPEPPSVPETFASDFEIVELEPPQREQPPIFVPPHVTTPPPASPPTIEQLIDDAAIDASGIELVQPDAEPPNFEFDIDRVQSDIPVYVEPQIEPIVAAPPAVATPSSAQTPFGETPPPMVETAHIEVPSPPVVEAARIDAPSAPVAHAIPVEPPAFAQTPPVDVPPPAVITPSPVVTPPPAVVAPAAVIAPPPAAPARQPITSAEFVAPPVRAPEPEPEPESLPEPVFQPPPPPPSPEPVAVASIDREPAVESEPETQPEIEPQALAANVLPMSRGPMLADPGHGLTGLDRLLRIAAARGASTLFVASKARPSIRVNGEMQMLDEPALGADDVESLLVELMPDRNRDALRTGVGTEWVCDVADVGRVSCMSFRDHRGAGAIFRMTPLRAISAEQLGLSREIRALATETEGLVLITGPRGSGKTTLLSAFVDLINRTRRVYVIAIERDIRVVHDSRHSLVSQREAKDDHETLEGVRTALREEPDVLVIEELRAADVASLALDAAGSGRLVIATVPAQTAIGAIEHVVNLGPSDQRRQVQLSLAENLRGIVAQVLVRKPGGGQMAARELLLNSSAVASLIAEGKLSQIGPTMESGRKFGMVPLNDALVACVKSGEVDAREAYRRAADRVGFLALLKRQGIDTTFVERPA